MLECKLKQLRSNLIYVINASTRGSSLTHLASMQIKACHSRGPVI